MRTLPILLGLFGLPLAEIAAFVAVGSEIGVGWTLLLVVLSYAMDRLRIILGTITHVQKQ